MPSFLSGCTTANLAHTSLSYLQLDYNFFRFVFHMPLSLKVSLAKLQLDYYPYHLARGERKHWVRYPADSPHRAWLQVYLEYILSIQGGFPYLIIVADAADAVSVNFSGRCKFLQI